MLFDLKIVRYCTRARRMIGKKTLDIEESNPNVPFKAYLTQLIMVLIVCLGLFLVGCSMGWVSPALQQLRSPHSPMKLSSDEEAKLAIYPEIGHLLIPMGAGYVADKLGRKMVFTISALFNLAGWTIKYYTSTLTMLLIARLLLGFHFGIQGTIMNIYTAEICSKTVRGSFSSLMLVSLSLGTLFMFVIGHHFSMQTNALVTAVISAFYLMSLFLLVESPYYLAAKKYYSEAKHVLSCLRATSSQQDISEELNHILKRTSAKIELSAPTLKSFGVCAVLALLCDMTGRAPIIAYATQNFSSEEYFSADSFTVLLGALNVAFPLVSSLLTDTVGRKVIIMVSGLVGGIANFSSGVLYYLHDERELHIPFYGWCLFAATTVFIFCSTIALTNVLIVRGELISENNRGLASGLISTVFAISILANIKIFQVTRDYCGLHYAFGLLGAFCVIFVVVTGIFLPETKGKTFDDIQRMFGRK